MERAAEDFRWQLLLVAVNSSSYETIAILKMGISRRVTSCGEPSKRMSCYGPISDALAVAITRGGKRRLLRLPFW